MTKKKLKIIGTVIAFFLYFILYFLYDKFPCFLTSIFSPINKSILEHAKMLFGCIMFSGVIQKLIIIFLKLDFKNNCISNFIGALSSIPIFLIMYLPFYYIVGTNIIIKIISSIITIIISEIISFVVMHKEDFHLEKATILFVIIVYIFFTLLIYTIF